MSARVLLFTLSSVIACREPDAERKADPSVSAASATPSISATIAQASAQDSGPTIGPAHHGSAVSQRDSRDPRKRTAAIVRLGAVSVTGKLPPEVIQRYGRSNVPKLRTCYEAALVAQPKLSGRVTTAFVVEPDGSVSGAKTTSDIANKELLGCIQKVIAELILPKPESGSVKATYPMELAPPAYKFTIGAKNGVDATEADVVEALATAGFTVSDASSPSLPARALSRFKAEKGGVGFSLTLDPAGTLTLDDYEKLRTTAVVLEDGEWALFVESSDPAQSRALIDAIHKNLEKNLSSQSVRTR